MKKGYLLIALLLLPMVMLAQNDVKRPKNIGNSDFDTFKNNSFDVKDESATLKENVTHIDKEIKTYSGIMNTIGVDKLKKNYKALKESQSAVKNLLAKLAELDEDGKRLAENAKNVKPKMKSISATNNTNKSLKGLKIAKTDLDEVKGLLETDIKLISEELKSRGEPIE